MITMCNHGSIVLMQPDDEDVLPFADWVADMVVQEDDVQFWGHALVVEPRYASDVVSALQADGFEVLIP